MTYNIYQSNHSTNKKMTISEPSKLKSDFFLKIMNSKISKIKTFHSENVAVDSQWYVRSVPTFLESFFNETIKQKIYNIISSFFICKLNEIDK